MWVALWVGIKYKLKQCYTQYVWQRDGRLQRAAQEADDFIIAARRLVNVGCLKHWLEAVPPKPDRFMTYVNAPLMQYILHIKKR